MTISVVDKLLDETVTTVSSLGKDGGLITASIYDTSQVLRFWPSTEKESCIAWLLEQQGSDGGWAFQSASSYFRDLPTLAAVLALHSQGRAPDAVRAGLAFLREGAAKWSLPLPDAIPVGVELIFPRLVGEAQAAGLEIATEPYHLLLEIRRRKLRAIEQVKASLHGGSPPAFVWDGWGEDADLLMLDERYGSVGYSPAATAVWLRKTASRSDLTKERSRAEEYLTRAARVTGTNIPGVVPGYWPMERCEQGFGLWPLLVTGLLDHPRLRSAIDAQVQDLFQGWSEAGAGFADGFVPDGDTACTAFCVLRAKGLPVQASTVHRFKHGRYYVTYPGELQHSMVVTAKAAYALAQCGEDVSETRNLLVELVSADGVWPNDKWNWSWIYVSLHAIMALAGSEHSGIIERACHKILSAQRPDGGWGTADRSTVSETAYAVLSLLASRDHRPLAPGDRQALERGHHWLLEHHRGDVPLAETYWCEKVACGTPRMDRLFELSALLGAQSELEKQRA
jgi:hypothetical protein